MQAVRIDTMGPSGAKASLQLSFWIPSAMLRSVLQPPVVLVCLSCIPPAISHVANKVFFGLMKNCGSVEARRRRKIDDFEEI